jgi:iron complex transport system ATP-binding protein
MSADKYIIDTQELCIGYQTKGVTNTIASNLNLKLSAGQLISIVGANGIGKSTLLRTLTGIQKPISGKVYLNKKNVHQIPSAELAQELSLVLTEKLPQNSLSVYELIALGRQPYTNWLGQLSKEDHKKIEQAIALTQTEHLVTKKQFEISDGQMQIVLIARALAQDTPLIILDEPTTHLDLLHKVSVFKLLKKLSQETNKCILFSTHDIDLAIQLSNQMIVMTENKVSQDEPCNLISQGIFNTLFKDDAITFDNDRGKFIIS